MQEKLFVTFCQKIFELRAQIEGISLGRYIENFMAYLNIRQDKFLANSLEDNSGFFFRFIALINFLISYLTHSFSTTMGIYEFPRHEHLNFIYIQNLLYKLGIFNDFEKGEWFLSGRLPSLPGSIYHEFGFVGVVFGAAILGIFSGLSCLYSSARPLSIYATLISVAFLIILVLSPYINAVDMLHYPYFILSSLTVIICSSFIRKIKKMIVIKRLL